MKSDQTQREQIKRQVIIRYNRCIVKDDFSKHFKSEIANYIADITHPDFLMYGRMAKMMDRIETMCKAHNYRLSRYLRLICQYVEGQQIAWEKQQRKKIRR